MKGIIDVRSKVFWGFLFLIIAGIYSIVTGDAQTGVALVGIGLSLLGIEESVKSPTPSRRK